MRALALNYFAIPGLVRQKEYNVNYIFQIVCDYYGLSVADAIRVTRKREIVQARQVAMYFSKMFTGDSLAYIGSNIGGKDHATVLHACRTVNNLIDTDKRFAGEIGELMGIIKMRL
jgi:chromosomal replication initiator protein